MFGQKYPYRYYRALLNNNITLRVFYFIFSGMTTSHTNFNRTKFLIFSLKNLFIHLLFIFVNKNHLILLQIINLSFYLST